MTIFVPHIMMERIIKTIFLFTRCLFSLLVLLITLITTRFPIVLPLTIFFLFLIVVVIAAVRKLILISTVVVIFLVPILIIIIIFSFILKPVVISESSI